MRSKSTLLLVAIGCFVWFAQNRLAITAQSNGEAATFDLWLPFLIPFGLASLVRAIYRKLSNSPKSYKSAEHQRSPTGQVSKDSEHIDESTPLLVSLDPEVQQIQAELDNAQEKLELNQTNERIDSIYRRLKEAEEHLKQLKIENASANEDNSLNADEQRVERLEMQLATAKEIAELRAELESKIAVVDHGVTMRAEGFGGSALLTQLISPQRAHGVDSGRAWLTVLATFLSSAVTFGILYSFGPFQDGIRWEFGAGLGLSSLMFGITMFLFFGTGVISGRWCDRYGPRPLLAIGGSLFVGGLVAASFTTAIWQTYAVYGLGLGFGGGLYISPLFATVATFFVKYRTMAIGIAATGSGIGTLLLVPFATSLIQTEGWREAFRVLAVISAVCLVVATFLVRRSPVQTQANSKNHVGLVVKTPEFKILCGASALMSTALMAAFVFVFQFALEEGFSHNRAALLISAIGGSSILGWLLLTSLAGRLGAVRLLQLSFAAQPVAYLVWMFADGKYWLLMIFALLLGVTYGGYVALIGAVAAHYFGMIGIGSVMGYIFFFSGVGSLIGPPLAAFLNDMASTRFVPLGVIFFMSLMGALILASGSRDPVNFEAGERMSLPRTMRIRKTLREKLHRDLWE